VLSYKKMYFGNIYHTNDMYKINTTILTSVINEISNSAYSSTLWHTRLCHIDYSKIFNMKKLGLLPNCGVISLKKCEFCAHTKITRKLFPNITRSTNLLDLIHSDTCDFKRFATRGGMKYFITFIDDHSHFHLYLLKSKDEDFS